MCILSLTSVQFSFSCLQLRCFPVNLTAPLSLVFLIGFQHSWDKHSLQAGFSYTCDISSCCKQFKNLQSYRRHVKSKHLWFFERYMKCFRAALTTNEKKQDCQGTISDIEMSVDGQVEEPDDTAMPNNNST